MQVLTGRKEAGAKTGFAAFAPIIDTFLKEHLFADIFSRDVLNYLQPELVTITALASMTGVEAQLQSHMGIGLNVGITKTQLSQMLDIIQKNIGDSQAEIGRQVLAKLITS